MTINISSDLIKSDVEIKRDDPEVEDETVSINLFQTSKYTAIIVEPREHKALAFVLKNFLENLNEDWNIIILHGMENKKYVKKIMEKLKKQHPLQFNVLIYVYI